MSSWIHAIPIIGDLIKGTGDIVREVVVDKDKQNEIIGNLEKIGHQVYLAELATKTVPWVDALHKMGRQILNIANLVVVVVLVMYGVQITQEIALLLGGPNLAYQLIKGRGQ